MSHATRLVVIYWLLGCIEAGNPKYLGPGPDGQPRRLGPWDLELDLDGNADPSKLILRNLKPYDIDVRQYELKEGYRLSRLTQSQHELWSNTRNLECRYVSLAYQEGAPAMLCVACEGRTSFYYVRDQDSWRGVRDLFFYSLFNDFVLEKTEHEQLQLDLDAEPDQAKFYVNNWEKFPFKIVVPKVSVSLSRISQGGSTVWEAKSRSGRALYVSLYKGFNYRLLCVIAGFHGAKTYFKQSQPAPGGRSWERIEREEYDALLTTAGLDLRALESRVTLDLSSPNPDWFIQSQFGSEDAYLHKFTARPGLMLTRVLDGRFEVWSARDEFCGYAGLNLLRDCRLLVLYLKHLEGRHSLKFFRRSPDGSWAEISGPEYHSYLIHGRLLGSEGAQLNVRDRVKLGSFRNKQGLKIRTYFAPHSTTSATSTASPAGGIASSSGTNSSTTAGDGVDKGGGEFKGTFVLVHGNREYFMSNFLSYNKLWNYEKFGFPAFPFVNEVSDFELYNPLSSPANPRVTLGASDSFKGGDAPNRNANANVNSNFKGDENNPFNASFENKFEDYFRGDDLERYSYEGSLVQALNEMGYDVYGLDLQSYGLSESFTPKRCYVNDFEDFVDDVLQFVDLVKRGEFVPEGQEYLGNPLDGRSPYSEGTGRLNNALYVLGYSMGANVLMQAAQKFSSMAPSGVRFANGLVSLSGMAKLDHSFKNSVQRAFMLLGLGFLSMVAPRADFTFRGEPDWTAQMSYYLKLCDGYYYSKSYSNRMIHQLFSATEKLKREMNKYPHDLHTLFIHSRNDPVCSIEGVRELYDQHVNGRSCCGFVELKGDSHDTPDPQHMSSYLPALRAWLAHIATPSGSTAAPPPPTKPAPKHLNITWESITYEIVLFMILTLFIIAAAIFGILNYVAKRRARGREQADVSVAVE